MAITKQKKQAIVASFEEILSGANSVVFVQFDKLSVKGANALRRKLRSEGVGYKVGKKTLLKRVLETKGYAGALPELSGEVAIAYGSDLLAPAREVHEFQKANKEVAIIGGVFEGSYKDKTEMTSLATIPSREVLLSQLAFLLKSPMQRLAIAVGEVAKSRS